jgi:outer membrane protein TolC
LVASLDGPPNRRIAKVPYCAGLARRSHRGCDALEEICANLCPDDVVDALAISASGGREELPACTLPTAPPKVAKPRTTGEPKAQEIWPLTLREAIRIALDNGELTRVIAACGLPGVGGCFEPTAYNIEGDDKAKAASIVIARLCPDASIWRFKAEIMAQVRSVEQAYWNLAQAHVQLWAADRAVNLAQEVYQREKAELVGGRGTVADIAEAAQRLEQLNLDLVTRTSDVITTERQLRNLLGLPPADNRRIIPVTPATEARIEPDWDTSLAEMLESQPDVVQQRLLVRVAELQLLLARNQLLPRLGPDALHQLRSVGWRLDSPDAVLVGSALKALGAAIDAAAGDPTGHPDPNSSAFLTQQIGVTCQLPLMTRSPYPLGTARSAQYVLLRSRAYYEQVVHQATHSLARFFLEIDANYKQFKTASRLRAAAAQRLDAQRAYYEEGRITIDRFLDAVSQYATAVATEAQYKAAYNVSIAALEEAKGTLLAYDNIVIAAKPRKTKAIAKAAVPSDRGPSKQDKQVVTASATIEPQKAYHVPPTKAPCTSEATRKAAAPHSETWSFSLSIGGTHPIEIKGTITAGDAATSPAAR